ncbi:MAG: hypothetical protein ABIH68_00225 [bacterium]
MDETLRLWAGAKLLAHTAPSDNSHFSTTKLELEGVCFLKI